MSNIKCRYYHFPPAIIQHTVWLYSRFTLSFRDVEDLLAERGIEVSYETVRRWVSHFGLHQFTLRQHIEFQPYRASGRKRLRRRPCGLLAADG